MSVQLGIAIGLLCFVQSFVAGGYDGSCRCNNDKSKPRYGFFLCPPRTMAEGNVLELPESQCANVSVAFLEYNRLTYYPFLLRDRRFQMIILSHNRLKFLPQAQFLSSNVKYLDISWNKIKNSGDELRNASSLKTLLLTGNGLTSLQFLPESCALELLDVSSNYITQVDTSLRRCSTLTALNLSNNRISSISEKDFVGLKFLKTLQLGQNPLSNLPDGIFSGLSYLEGLSLKHTQVSNINQTMFTGLKKLEYLDISGNNMVELPAGVFREIPNIETLVIDDNKLSQFPDQMFTDLTNLANLFVRSNMFTTFPVSIVFEDRPSPLAVDLKHNPIHPRSLRGAFIVGVNTQADAVDCSCRILSHRHVAVRVCVEGPCSHDWMGAVGRSPFNLNDTNVQDGGNSVR